VSISISRPQPDASVGWTFDVTGAYDLAAALAPAGPPIGTIVVTVYQSDGTTPLPNTTVTPNSIAIPASTPSGTWQVSVTHNANYSGAVIAAVLTPTGGSPQTAEVTGIDISQ
jgi:hypothetical protein